MLAKGDALLCIDSRRSGVQVPRDHMNKSNLRLILNLGFRHPITLLSEGIQADLLFSGVLHHCWIPYESIWGVFNPVSGEGALWVETLPDELQGLPARIRQRDAEEYLPSTNGLTVFPDTQEDQEHDGPEETGNHDAGRGLKPVPSAEDRPVPSSPRQTNAGKKPSLRVIPGGKKD